MDKCEEVRVVMAAKLRAVAVFSHWIKNTIRMAMLNLCFYFVSVTSYKDKVHTQINVLGRLRQNVAASPPDLLWSPCRALPKSIKQMDKSLTFFKKHRNRKPASVLPFVLRVPQWHLKPTMSNMTFRRGIVGLVC